LLLAVTLQLVEYSVFAWMLAIVALSAAAAAVLVVLLLAGQSVTASWAVSRLEKAGCSGWPDSGRTLRVEVTCVVRNSMG
jgi:hypothetical protein